MTAQDMIEAARLTHVRELQTQLARAADENRRLATENAELKAHFDLALLAAEDLRSLPAGGRLVIVDGWNAILGDARTGAASSVLGVERYHARDPEALIVRARQYASEHPADFVWIIFDGPRENVRTEGRVRVSYTGGKGAHRADRFICDFLRMAKFRNALDRIVVETRDRDFQRTVARLR